MAGIRKKTDEMRKIEKHTLRQKAGTMAAIAATNWLQEFGILR